MRCLIAPLMICVLGTAALAQELDREAVAYQEVVRYIDDWTKNLAPRHRGRAMKHVYSVAHWSVHYDIDPLLVAVKVSLESSWRANVTGKTDNEMGLLQIHPSNKRALKGFDISDPDQQVQAGVKWLRVCIDTCGGDVKQGVNMYATGSCTKKWSGLQYRWRLYKRAVKLFRGQS